ncbi:DNA cytosine methyltransferase [Mailhella sp.]
MRYLSVCSGIEAASVAWHPLGWEPAAFAEIEPFPCAVLAHHYPDVPNLGDISKVDWRPYHGTVDLVVGGTPCQSFSIAGRREGLDGASGLVFEYFRLLSEIRPRWFVWENVPGAFSSNKGADFQSILREWDKLGYHVAWRVLDAQFFGVPQRRRRIFAVGHLGNWRYPAKVLFEPDCLRGDTPKIGKARKGSAASAETSPRIDWPARVGATLNAHFGEKMGRENQHINQGAPLFVPAPVCAPVTTTPYADNIAQESRLVVGTLAASGAGTQRPAGQGNELDFCITKGQRVRRLTPRECERLQGFPDDYTLIAYRGKPAPDGPRYKALGNSMAVPCMRWIGERIMRIEHQLKKKD